MPSIKEYNVKLKSLKNTQKITRTMKMVSASKLRRAHQAQANAKKYAKCLVELIGRISYEVDSKHHPFLTRHDSVKNALILVITSDKGLCGAFNHNANKHTLDWLNQNKEQYERIDLSFCGRRGYQFFKSLMPVKDFYKDITIKPTFESAEKIGDDIARYFLEGQYDEVYLAYNQFLSPLSQKTIFEKILPLDPESLLDEPPQKPIDYIYEPEAGKMLEFLIPHFLYFKIYFALLENSAGEHGARMAAMDNATKNASQLIETNTLLRNRARQAQITTELTEIVAGAEALN
jgi:F-type H+-transporting ATPase subunit gamma